MSPLAFRVMLPPFSAKKPVEASKIPAVILIAPSILVRLICPAFPP